MKILKTITRLSMLCMGLSLCACMNMEYSQEQLKKVILGNFPIDTVDVAHDWNLLQSHAVTVHVDVNDWNIRRVQILNGNPYEREGVEVLADRLARTTDVVSPVITVPDMGMTLYAAAINADGRYYVVPIGPQQEADFTHGSVTSTGTLHQPVYQTFTYLFEEDFPLPGDFDYNDVVLRISQQVVDTCTLKLKVRLAAVGARGQVGAAIRLPEIYFTDVESVTIDEGSRFDEDYTTERFYIDNDKVLVKGRDGSAVINLFEDAHWSLNPVEEYGQVKRMYYNTVKYEVKDEATTIAPQERTYTITFRKGLDASFMKLADIDPFIMVNSNGLVLEVHTYRYKYAEAIWHYTTGSNGEDEHVTWALLIPDGQFHYPIEGIFIGRYRNGEVSGAYSRLKHSFGEWGRNRNTAIDWWYYDNATKAQVY